VAWLPGNGMSPWALGWHIPSGLSGFQNTSEFQGISSHSAPAVLFKASPAKVLHPDEK